MTTQNELTNSQVLNAMVSSAQPTAFRSSSKKAHANRSSPVKREASAEGAVIFLDGDIAPEGAAISEQPEISAMQRIQANEMHRANAQRGVAFASQSEHTSGDAKERLRDPRRKEGSRRIFVPEKRTSSSARKAESRSSPQKDNSSSLGSNSDASMGHESSTQERNLSESRDQFEIAVSSPSARSRGAKKDLHVDANNDGVAEQQQTEQTTADEKLPWHKRTANFFKKNLMVVLALVVLLIFCGVGAYLYVKTKIEARKRAADRAEMQAVLEQEEALPRRDATIDQLRAENAALRIATEQAREICAAFEQKMSQAEQQNQEQMHAIEKLSSINEDWSLNYAEQMQILQLQQERLQQQEERLQQLEESEKTYASVEKIEEADSAQSSEVISIKPDAAVQIEKHESAQIHAEPEPENQSVE